MIEYEQEIDELADIPRQSRRRVYRCSDRMCGATDCSECFPDQPQTEDEE